MYASNSLVNACCAADRRSSSCIQCEQITSPAGDMTVVVFCTWSWHCSHRVACQRRHVCTRRARPHQTARARGVRGLGRGRRDDLQALTAVAWRPSKHGIIAPEAPRPAAEEEGPSSSIRVICGGGGGFRFPTPPASTSGRSHTRRGRAPVRVRRCECGGASARAPVRVRWCECAGASAPVRVRCSIGRPPSTLTRVAYATRNADR